MQHSAMHIWDVEHVKLLLLQPTTLCREEPFCDWLRAQGGLAAVYAHLTAVRLPSKLHRLRTLLLEEANSPPCIVLAKRLGLSRKTIYRQLARLALELAGALNMLDGVPVVSTQQVPHSAVRHTPAQQRIANSA